MDRMWDKLKKSLKDGAVYSIEKIEEYSKIGKLTVEEIAAKRKITRNFNDIGERVFDLIEANKSGEIDTDLPIKTSMENIKALRQEIAEIERKIKDIQDASKKHEPEADEMTGI